MLRARVGCTIAQVHLPLHHPLSFPCLRRCSKNGEHLGVAFRNVCGHPLFPTIGLHRCGAGWGGQPANHA